MNKQTKFHVPMLKNQHKKCAVLSLTFSFSTKYVTVCVVELQKDCQKKKKKRKMTKEDQLNAADVLDNILCQSRDVDRVRGQSHSRGMMTEQGNDDDTGG